jgi:competence ComEA-like helix-hairpin-helix protein
MVKEANLATIRKFIVDHYDDAELTRFCFDHFHEVFNDFPAEASKGRKAIQLLGFCQRRGLVPELLSRLNEERPELYTAWFGPFDIETAVDDIRINLNTATQTQLSLLPAIGPSLAKAIIDHRPFTSIDDLHRVPGVGEKRFEAFREWCRV